MNIYAAIIMILDKKGPASIPSIYQEIMRLNRNLGENERMIDPSYLWTMIVHKQEWFMIDRGIVSIRPERDPIKFTFMLYGYPGPDIKVQINFKRKTFIYLEWCYEIKGKRRHLYPMKAGSVEEFKRQLYFLHIWDWEQDYQADGIIVDGKEWSVVLETRGTVYKSVGLNSFPKEWKKTCREISRLTGIQIIE